MRTRPDHRHLAVLTALQRGDPAPVDPLSAQLFAHLDNGQAPDNVVYAHDLREEDEHRPIVDAFLLAGCSFEETASVLEIELEVVTIYAHLFMDVAVFRNRLERISFASRYESSAYGKELVKTAVTVGVEYLHWAYGKTPASLDARTVIARTMTDAYFRGMAHKGNALTTGTAKEALRWWQTGIKNAELMERLNPSTAKQALDELRIALGQQDATSAADKFEVPPSEILH